MKKLKKYIIIGSIEAIAYLLSRGISFQKIVDSSFEYLTDRLLSSLLHFGFDISSVDESQISRLPYMDENYLPYLYHNVSPNIRLIILNNCRKNFCHNAIKNIEKHNGCIDLQTLTTEEIMKYDVDSSWVRHIIRCDRIDLLKKIIIDREIYINYDCYRNITYDVFMFLFTTDRLYPAIFCYAICNIGDIILDVLPSNLWIFSLKLHNWAFLYCAIKNHHTRCIEYFLQKLPKLSAAEKYMIALPNLDALVINKVVNQKIPHYIYRRNGNPVPSIKCAIRLLTQMVLYSDGYLVYSVEHSSRFSTQQSPGFSTQQSLRFFTITAHLPFEIQTIIACIYGNIEPCAIVINNSNIWRELV